MVIYGNNMHEKLFGNALSKDYLAYATPFCELVDDPDFEVDVDIAVNFHAAWNNGDIDAARRAIETLVINSANLDQSTLNFYCDKMKSHPFFSGEIDRINAIFNDSNYPDVTRGDDEVEFIDALKEAASDCWNSPCNIFSETSDSVGRLAQVGSNKTSSNSFDVGSVAGTLTNLYNGLDDAVRNSIPEMFANGVASITQTAKQAWSNTQEAFVGKENIEGVLNHLVANGNDARSYRDSNGQPLLYTPDIKSFFDLDQVATNILTEISAELGGCADKAQSALRYNPYRDNTSTPANISTGQANGKKYTRYNDGIYPTGDIGASDAPQTSQGGIRISNDNTSYKTGDDDRFVRITKSIIFSPQTIGSVGSYYNKEEKVLILDTSSADRRKQGKVGIAKVPDYCPSGLNSEGDGARAAQVLLGKPANLDETGAFAINKIANDYTFSKGDEADGHTGHFSIEELPKEFNEGVFLSSIFTKFFDGFDDAPSDSIAEAIQERGLYAILTPRGSQDRKYVRVIGPGEGDSPRIDLTPAAYNTVFGTLPKKTPSEDRTTKKFKDAGWQVYLNTVAHTVDCEVRLAIGDPYDIMAYADEVLTASSNTTGSDIVTQTPVIYKNSGKIRNKPIHPDLYEALTYAAGAINAQRVEITSGGQTSGNSVGSSRHNVYSVNGGYGGMAADFKVYDSQGRVLPISDNSSWTKIARRFVSFVRGRGYTPAGGAGPNYMGDTVHFDIARGYTSTTQSNFWISTKSGVSSSQKIRTTPWLAEFK